MVGNNLAHHYKLNNRFFNGFLIITLYIHDNKDSHLNHSRPPIAPHKQVSASRATCNSELLAAQIISQTTIITE